MEKLLLFPFSGNAKEALDAAFGQFEVVAFIDDSPNIQGTSYMGIPVLSRDALHRFSDAKVLAVPGNEFNFAKRGELIHSLGLSAERFANLVHPKATLGNYLQLGSNNLILAGTVLTSNVKLEDHCIILCNSTIHHDTTIGSLSIVGSNVVVAGGVQIESNCYIGSGSCIKNGLTIQKGTIVGLGSNVISNFPSNAKLVGNPARDLNH